MVVQQDVIQRQDGSTGFSLWVLRSGLMRLLTSSRARAGRLTNLLLITAIAFALAAQGPLPNFSGTWKQSNEQSSPKRSNNVTLRSEHLKRVRPAKTVY
jgi:hypothetical protein